MSNAIEVLSYIVGNFAACGREAVQIIQSWLALHFVCVYA